jgi:hypothetical protein
MKIMDIKLLLILFLSSYFYSISQNLVPNPSFETYTTCPFNTAQLEFTTNWVKCSSSTDYFNSCAGGGFVSVPLNLQGYQQAAEGNGYIGIIAYALHDNGNGPTLYREPAGTLLTQTLSIGTKYYASFKVAPTINNFESCCAVNKLGLRFSTVKQSTINPAPVNNFAHIYSNTIITDTLNWTTIKGSFIADSAYTFVAIGNFFDTLSTSVIDYNNDYPNTYGAYYYVDDVRISTDSNFVLAYIDNFDKENFSVYPNPFFDKIKIRKGLSSIHHVVLYNALGQIVVQKKDISDEIDLSCLPPGVYILEIKSKNNQIGEKIKIQKL